MESKARAARLWQEPLRNRRAARRGALPCPADVGITLDLFVGGDQHRVLLARQRHDHAIRGILVEVARRGSGMQACAQANTSLLARSLK